MKAFLKFFLSTRFLDDNDILQLFKKIFRLINFLINMLEQIFFAVFRGFLKATMCCASSFSNQEDPEFGFIFHSPSLPLLSIKLEIRGC